MDTAPPRQRQLLLAPSHRGQSLLQLPWQDASPRCQGPIHVGPEPLRKRSWWGQELFAQWGRHKFATSVHTAGSCPRHGVGSTPHHNTRQKMGNGTRNELLRITRLDVNADPDRLRRMRFALLPD
jgi:hypothetical protein